MEGRNVTDEAPTARAVEILRRVATGQRQADIAAAMSISVDTIRRDLDGLRAYLNARNNAHAVAIALRTGLLSTSDTEEV